MSSWLTPRSPPGHDDGRLPFGLVRSRVIRTGGVPGIRPSAASGMGSPRRASPMGHGRTMVRSCRASTCPMGIHLATDGADGRAPSVCATSQRRRTSPAGNSRDCAELLASDTKTPDRCYAGYWGGYGWVPFSDITGGPELALDERTFLVRGCSLESGVDVNWSLPGRQHDVGASAPCSGARIALGSVASDPDLDSTLVGGSAAFVSAVLDDPFWEAWPATANDLTCSDDPINGPSASAT